MQSCGGKARTNVYSKILNQEPVSLSTHLNLNLKLRNDACFLHMKKPLHCPQVRITNKCRANFYLLLQTWQLWKMIAVNWISGQSRMLNKDVCCLMGGLFSQVDTSNLPCKPCFWKEWRTAWEKENAGQQWKQLCFPSKIEKGHIKWWEKKKLVMSTEMTNERDI